MGKINSVVEGIYLTYTNENIWKIFFLGEIHDLDKNDYRVILSLVVFLEIGRESIFEKIKDNTQKISFPEELIIEAGFILGSQYWVELAVKWLAEIPNYDENLFDKYLREIAFNKRYGQKLRHSVIRFLKHKKFYRE